MYFTQPLHRNLQRNPEKVMTILGDRQRSVAEFVDRVARLAAAFREIGVNPGDRIGILGLNSDRYMEYLFAVPWADGVLNPCNIRWNAKENAYALEDSCTSVLLVDDAFLEMGLTLAGQVETLRHVVYTGDGETPAGMLDYETLIDAASPAEDARRGGNQLLGVFYTGGTTGFPKGVMISHNAFWASQTGLAAAGVMAPEATMLRAAPMFHMADLAAGYLAVMQNATHAILPAYQPTAALEAIQRHRATTTIMVPTMIQMLVYHPEVRNFDLSSMGTLIYGGSPIQEKVVLDALELIPGLRMFQAYGQTEMAPVVTLLGPEEHSPEGARAGLLRSCGRPTLAVEVRIIDENGGEVTRGEVGEVAVRGPNMMTGYWEQPDQTRDAIPADGWLRTGDGGRMDEDGYVYIVDRMKDMIVTGGENVYSVEVENALASHPAVAMCAVIGVPSDEWGEAVHAFVVPRDGVQVAEADLIRHCREMIAGYKCPKQVELCASLPLSGAGKVLKSELRKRYWGDHERRVG